MTPKAARSLSKLILGAALLTASFASDRPAAAQSLTPAPSFAASLDAIAARAAAQKNSQKAAATKAAPSKAYLEGYADGWGATAVVPHLLAARVQPDYSYTPGHLCTPSDPNFKEYRYAEHIPYCQRNVTYAMKQEIAAHYGVPQSDWPSYEFDHLIPLAIGGDSSVDNLWPQPHGMPDGSNGKDKLEYQLYLQMKNGAITQAQAVKEIYDWFTVSDMAHQIANPSLAAR
ncbi:MAG: hypothetical protein KGM24_13880 [Elusimicrobia bacterium]|nr:hypothetical protein [Elusimicrobiota bacterium]